MLAETGRGMRTESESFARTGERLLGVRCIKALLGVVEIHLMSKP